MQRTTRQDEISLPERVEQLIMPNLWFYCLPDKQLVIGKSILFNIYQQEPGLNRKRFFIDQLHNFFCYLAKISLFFKAHDPLYALYGIGNEQFVGI